jgi:hypothetical protein
MIGFDAARVCPGERSKGAQSMITKNQVRTMSAKATRRAGRLLSKAGEQARDRLPDRDEVARGAALAGTMLATALRASADRLEGKQKPVRRWPWVLVGFGVGAAAVIAVTRVRRNHRYGSEPRTEAPTQDGGADLRSVGEAG